jgi:signal transduction histidine kinase
MSDSTIQSAIQEEQLRIALTMEPKRRTGEFERRATRLEIVARVSSAITRILDLQELLQTVVDLTKGSLGLYHAHIYLLDEEGENLVLAAGAGEVGRMMVEEGHRIALNRQKSLVARAARTRESVTVNDVRQEEGFLPNIHLPNTRSELALPMIVGDELIGVLDVQSDQVEHFGEEEIRIQLVLTQQVAIAVANARAFAVAQRQVQLQTATASVAEYLRSDSPILEDILENVLQVIGEVFHADNLVMSRYDHEKNQWQGVTGVGGGMTRALARTFVDPGERYPHAMECITENKVVAVDNAHKYPNFPPEYLDEKIGIKSVIVLPLTIQKRASGVIFANFTSQYHRFRGEELALANALSDRISVGLDQWENERTIRQTRNRAERLAHDLEIVTEVATKVSNILDLDTLLEEVVELTKQRFNLYHAHVYLVSENRDWLLLAAGSGEPGRIMRERGHRIAYHHPQSIVARVAREATGLFVNDVTTSPNFLPNPLLPNTRSENAVPMFIGNEVIGVLDVQSELLDRFDEIDVATKSALAAQIAVAIQNARAFSQVVEAQTELAESLIERAQAEEKARNRAAELETVAMVSAVSSAVFDLDELLQTVVDLTKANFELYHTHIYLIDDKREYLVLAAGAGEPGQLMKARGHRISTTHPHSLVARAARSGQGVISNNVKAEADFLPNPLLPDTLSEMALPLIVGDKIIGVLDIQADRIERFTEDDLLVHTTLSSQIAVAVQNAQAVQQMRQVDRLKSQFLANMSHELRTPLNSIIGYSEIMMDGDDGELSDEALEDIKTIHNSGKHLLAIINEILDLAKIEAGQIMLDLQTLDMKTIISEVTQSAQVLVRHKPVTLSMIEESPITPIEGDIVRVRQILNNLVSNASKFTEQGSIVIAYGMATPKRLYVEVRDTGIGMSAADMEVIFQQFRQVDGSSTRRAGGTGLGLTITRHLVELHGGTIEVKSNVGEGSTFRVMLPALVMEAATV